jgi:hypothetical protein
VLDMGHAYFRELREDEVRRISLLGSRVNKGSRNPDSCAPTAPATLHLAFELSVSLAYLPLYATTSPAVTWGGFGAK